MNKVNYLNHTFLLKSPSVIANSYINNPYYCENCSIEVIIFNPNGKIMCVFNHSRILDLTCDEMIIKNILE